MALRTWPLISSGSRRHLVVAMLILPALFLLPFVMTGGPAAASVGSVMSSWGANSFGELGNGTITDSSSPVPVVGFPNGVSAFASGARHSLAIKTDGSVVAWGRGIAGELGNGL